MPSIHQSIQATAVVAPSLDQVLGTANDANAQKIANMADPTLAQDAATKAYVDTGDLVAVDTDGFLHTAKNAAPADASLSAGEFKLWFDKTNGAARLMLKAKTADGTVVTGSVNLT